MSDVIVEIHSSGVEMQIDRANDLATFAVASQALIDCNYYCKHDYGALIFSSVIHTSLEGTVNTSNIPEQQLNIARMSPGSDLDKGILRWVMPYAEMQYELVAARLDKNPNATYHWCDTAYANHGDNWQRIFAAALRRGGG